MTVVIGGSAGCRRQQTPPGIDLQRFPHEVRLAAPGWAKDRTVLKLTRGQRRQPRRSDLAEVGGSRDRDGDDRL